MLTGVETVAPPPTVYRVSYGPDPFKPVPWRILRGRVAGIARKHDPQQLGGRFDDPASFRRDPYPETRRFRTLYFATDPAGAFVEALQDFARWHQPLSHGLQELVEREPELAKLVDLQHPTRGIVPWSWFQPRVLGSARLAPGLCCVDVRAGTTIQHLGPVLADLLTQCGRSKMGYSIIVGQERELTQAIANHFYEHLDDATDTTPYAGLRYLSDLNQDFECWAIFAQRLLHDRAEATRLDQRVVTVWQAIPGLWEAARFLHLTLEGPDNRLYRP
jgi:hypothetical protein